MTTAQPIEPDALPQAWPRPAAPRPITIIGAGSIVADAHLPAYRAMGFTVASIVDPDLDRARSLAARWQVPAAHASLGAAAWNEDTIFDVAVPPQALDEVLAGLPIGAAVLVQKPLGLDLAHATRLRRLARERRLRAAMNFQLRFAPSMIALGHLVRSGALGTLTDLEVRVHCSMPWHQWSFLRGLARIEFSLHSIHYLDLLRSLAGEPRRVWARAVAHPGSGGLAATRSSAIIDFGDQLRCTLSMNHHHAHGPRHEASELRVEGTRGAAIVRMGVNLDYPVGRPDTLEVALDGHSWSDVPLLGSWFPAAFRGPMCNLQRFVAGEDAALVSPIDDAWRTMQLVEALYDSSDHGGTPLPADPESTT
jgi:predicted dehydrogenase